MSLEPQHNAGPTDGEAGGGFTAWRFAALLGLLLIATFPQVVAGLEVFVRQDSARFAWPVAFYHREAFWRGELPLWNPLNGCGVPFLAQWNTLTLYPLSLFYLLLPLPWSFGVFCLGHLFLAGVGMYFLARRWTGNGFAAAVAGASFAFNGLTWHGLMWPHLIIALGWMPWVVLLVERGWRAGGRWLVVASLAGAMQMLSGGAEVIVFTWLALGPLWLVLVLRAEIPWRPMLGRAAVIVALTAGLAAAQLLPFLELLAHSQRNADYADASRVVMPLWGWANYLVPIFHGFRTSQGVFIQPTQNWLASYYVGAGVVALALFAIWRVPTRRVRLLTGLAGFGLIMAMGHRGILYDWVKRLAPMLGAMRCPVKWVMLPSFALPLLAAYGLSRLEPVRRGSPPGEWRKAKCLASGLVGLVALILWFARQHPLPADHVAATLENGAVRAGFLVLVFGCIALLRRLSNTRLQGWLQAGLVVLCWLDVFTHAPNLNPTAPRSVFEPDAARELFRWDDQFRAGSARVLQGRTSYWRMVTGLAGNQETDTDLRRLSQFANLNLLDHVSKFDGFYSLDLKEYGDLFNLVYFATNQAYSLSGLQDFMGIAATTSPTNDVEWTRRLSFLPMITAGQRPRFAGSAETLAALAGDSFEPLRTVFLPLNAQGYVRTTNAASARILSFRFSPHRLEIAVEADQPAWVLVAQSYFPAWHAYVNDEPTRLWRANHAFQALEVPAGKHRVHLHYEDRAFRSGLGLSLVSVSACGFIWYRSRRRERGFPGA